MDSSGIRIRLVDSLIRATFPFITGFIYSVEQNNFQRKRKPLMVDGHNLNKSVKTDAKRKVKYSQLTKT